jgi:hypothetical protein
MTPLKVINRPLISAAIFAVIPLLYPAIIFSQGKGTGTCSEWIDGKWRQVPCRPDPTPPPGTNRSDRDVYIPPAPEDSRLTEAREQNDLGMKASNSGNWGLAAQHFEQALRKDPNSTLYRDNLNNANRQIEIEANRREQERLQYERRKLEEARDKGGLKPTHGSNLFGLKPSNPALSDLRPPDNRIDRNFGKHPVWSQLNCAVDLTRRAMSAAPSPGEEPSFAESRNLLGEALNALNGNPHGVPCKMGGEPPSISGGVPDFTRAVKKGRDLIERASVAIDEMEKARLPVSEEERIASAYAQSKANEKTIAQRDAEALKQPREKLSPDQVVVPSPTAPPKAKPKSEFDKIKEEAQSLVSFPVKRRRGTTQGTTPK